MSVALAATGTLVEVLADRLRSCDATPDGIATPAAILWPDPERQWTPVIEQLRAQLPELLVLGGYDPDRQSGPAIWIRCVVDGTISLDGLPHDRPPIVYMPGVARQQLRAGEDCPRELQPLVELMYRGTLWLQRGGHEWTVTAFLDSPHGLDLDLARDRGTLEALLRALPEVAATPLSQLKGRRLEEEDFDRLLIDDLTRDVLRWMADPAGSRARMGDGGWASFRSRCRNQLQFDPETDGELEAGRLLGLGEGPWADVWRRFEEAPQAYPGISQLLRRSRPATLFADASRWPDENEAQEKALQKELVQIADLPHHEACQRIIELERIHGERRNWIWARLGEAPLASVLEPLAVLAKYATITVGGSTPNEIAQHYLEGPWQADDAALRALAAAPVAHEALIRKVVRALLHRWLEDSARAFQAAVEQLRLPTSSESKPVEVPEGACLMFVDGLRYDLGERLRDVLDARGCRVRVGHRWSALPTVTATAKSAATPVANDIRGQALPEDFAPAIEATRRTASAIELRKVIEKAGYQLLGGELGDWPVSDQARGWCEEGSIDRRGHQLLDELPGALDQELHRLVERIITVLDAGWSSVRVVTDHGWLLLPGGLPKVDLPKHLTESRWKRCATIAGASQVQVPTAAWHWNPSQRFATAPGIACFNASPAYAHGGISIQECLVPDIVVERADAIGAAVNIHSVSWRGMRCMIEAQVRGGPVLADLRRGGVNGRSIVASTKQLDEEGRTSLIVPDDADEGAEVTLILFDEADRPVAQQITRVGE